MSVLLELAFFLALVCQVPVESYVSIKVPSGPSSTLESYLCNGSLRSNVSLQLDAGEHWIHPGSFCSVFNVSAIRITGAGIETTIVRCDDKKPRGFGFLSVRNVTIEKVKFVGCGQMTYRNGSRREIFTTPLVLFFEATSAVTVQQVEITRFIGMGVVGYALGGSVTIREVKVQTCARGNCSGVLIYSDPLQTAVPYVRLHFCSFRDMRFEPSTSGLGFIGAGITILEQRSVIVDGCQFKHLEAPIGAAVSAKSASVLVVNSTFEKNIGYKTGAICSNGSTVELMNSSFTANVINGTGEGGAIYVYLSKIKTFGCWFENNTASIGGAVFIFGHFNDNRAQYLEQSTFVRNRAPIGAAIFAGDFVERNGSATYSLSLVNTVVKDNRCSCGMQDQTKGAAIYTSELSYLSIEGGEFTGNSPRGAIQVLAGRVHIKGNVTFRRNTGENGGALCLSNNALLYFYSKTNVKFSENRATGIGGALYIQGDPNTVKSDYIGCAINFPGDDENFTIVFNNNTAQLYGPTIYATPIYDCFIDVSSTLGPYLDTYNDFEFYELLFKITPQTENQILSFPEKFHICGCDKDTMCSVTDGNYLITLHPGGTIRFRATPRDSQNHTSPSVVYADLYEHGVVSPDAHFTHQQNIQWIDKECELIEYQIYGPENRLFDLRLFTYRGDVPDSIKINLTGCGRGFSFGMKTCKCSPFLKARDISCNVTDGMITRKRKWVGYSYELSKLAVARTCPLDYCRDNLTSVSLATEDALCNNGRTGVLCGHCHLSLSVVFGSSECRTCSNVWLLTILMYAVLGIALVTILFMLNLTVTEGTIYSLIFYANIVQVNAFIFFNQTYLQPLQIIISFINLDLGFPLCFYDGMDDAAKTGLQFVFPAYLLVLTIAFIVLCHYCLKSNFSGKRLNRFSRFVGKRAVSVLATLIYLSYSKLLRTVIQILTFATVHIDKDKEFRVWFYDGTIRYLEGKHLLLFLIAMVTSVFFLFPYTLALTLIPIIDKYSDHNRLFTWLHQKSNLLKPMNDAYYAPYKGKWRSWLGVRLWVLILLYVTTLSVGSDNPSLLLYIHAVVVIVFLFIQAQVKPFSCAPHAQKSRTIKFFNQLLNTVDLFYMLDYSILALTVSYLWANVIEDEHYDIAVGILVGLAVSVFCVTFLYHAIIAVIRVCKGEKKQEWLKYIEDTLSPKEISKPPTRIEMRASRLSGHLREPLIESQ